MNLQFLMEKLKNSEEFGKFIKENKNAYLCSGFFVIDLEKGNSSKYHLDFFVPQTGKIFCFELENKNLQQVLNSSSNPTEVEGIKLVPLERNEQVLEKISMKNDFDFDEIEKIILKEMEAKKIKNKMQKMIFSLQNLNGRDFLVGTIFVSGFGMIKANIDLEEKKIIDFEKKSFFDMLNILRKS